MDFKTEALLWDYYGPESNASSEYCICFPPRQPSGDTILIEIHYPQEIRCCFWKLITLSNKSFTGQQVKSKGSVNKTETLF